MPASANAATVLVDTSVAVALVVADHNHHEDVSRRCAGGRLVSPDTPLLRPSPS